MSNYINLHAHSHWSILDGFSTADEYAARLKELGMDYMATTEHGTLTSWRDFHKTAEKNSLTPVLGLEAYWTPDRFDRTSKAKRAEGDQVYNHIILLSKNDRGQQNIQAINKDSHLAGFYSKNRTDNTVLREMSDGVICLSGCLNSPIAKAFEYDMPEKAYSLAREFKEIFGDDYYIEVQTHNGKKMNGALLKLADDMGIKPVITCDCHSASPEDQWAQEALLILNTSPKKASGIDLSKAQKMEFYERMNYLYPERKMTFEHLELYLKDYVSLEQEMADQGFDRQDIFENTLEIADKIEPYTLQKDLDLLPRPTNASPDVILKNLAYTGLANRGKQNNAEYKDRLKRELGVITEKNFSTYFLIVSDAIDWAKSQDIPMGFGRGSAAGSLVCYVLGITETDPLEYDLSFERFLDPSRDEMPDVDVDIADSRRGELKEYLERKFKNVGHIMTFAEMDGKSLIKDASRVYGIPLNEVESVCKKFDVWDDYLKFSSTKEFRQKYPEVTKLAAKLRGRIRSRGVHAGALVVSSKPIEDVAPIESSTNKDDESKDRISVVAMDKKEAEELGLVKIDFLGLKTLGIVDTALRTIKDRKGVDIDIYKIKPTDKTVLASITKDNASGIFQVDGQAFRNILDQYTIESFEDIYNLTALIRPGAADSEFGQQYREYKMEGKVTHIHPEVDWVTDVTGGAILFQEQVMMLCQHLAGMTASESNKVRKSISAKIAEDLQVWGPKFIDGASLKIGNAKATKLWENIMASANYSFNKSHSVTYSMLTYITAYLKHYYPVEYFLALISAEKDLSKRVEYLIAAKKRGIEIRMPHVNISDYKLNIGSEGGKDFLIFGLTNIKNIGDSKAKKLIEQRPFDSYAHLKEVAEKKYSGISSLVITSLDKIGAATFEDNPLTGDEPENYYEYLNLPSFDVSGLPDYAQWNIRAVEDFDPEDTFVMLSLVQKVTRKNGWARADVIDFTGSAGVFFEPDMQIDKGKFYVMLVHKNSVLDFIEVSELGGDNVISRYLLTEKFRSFHGGRVLAFVPRVTKAGKTMATLVVTDENKALTGMLVWPGDYLKAAKICTPGAVVQYKVGTKIDRGKETVFLDYIGE